MYKPLFEFFPTPDMNKFTTEDATQSNQFTLQYILLHTFFSTLPWQVLQTHMFTISDHPLHLLVSKPHHP